MIETTEFLQGGGVESAETFIFREQSKTSHNPSGRNFGHCCEFFSSSCVTDSIRGQRWSREPALWCSGIADGLRA